jgi:hypothetical protein
MFGAIAPAERYLSCAFLGFAAHVSFHATHANFVSIFGKIVALIEERRREPVSAAVA